MPAPEWKRRALVELIENWSLAEQQSRETMLHSQIEKEKARKSLAALDAEYEGET